MDQVEQARAVLEASWGPHCRTVGPQTIQRLMKAYQENGLDSLQLDLPSGGSKFDISLSLTILIDGLTLIKLIFEIKRALEAKGRQLPGQKELRKEVKKHPSVRRFAKPVLDKLDVVLEELEK